jgi:hypothetical protein
MGTPPTDPLTLDSPLVDPLTLGTPHTDGDNGNNAYEKKQRQKTSKVWDDFSAIEVGGVKKSQCNWCKKKVVCCFQIKFYLNTWYAFECLCQICRVQQHQEAKEFDL